MTKATTKGSWESEFDEFVRLGTDMPIEDTREFIRSLLASHQKELRERVIALKEIRNLNQMSNMGALARSRNKTLNEVLAILDSNTIND